MYWYTIGQTLTPQERAPAPEQPAVVLLTSEELSHQPELPGLERTLHHTPPARDARGPDVRRAIPAPPRQGAARGAAEPTAGPFGGGAEGVPTLGTWALVDVHFSPSDS